MLGYADQRSLFVHVCDDPIAVERLVGEQCMESAPLGLRRNAEGIETMSWHQHEAHEVAQGIGQRQYLGRLAALGLAYLPTLSSFLSPDPLPGRRLSSTAERGPVDLDDCCINHRHLDVGLFRQGIEYALKYLCHTPVAKPESDRVPLAEFTKKVPPLCPSSGNPEHRFKKQTGVAARLTRIGPLAQTVRFNLRPMAIIDDIAIYRSPFLPFGKFESEFRLFGNSDTQLYQRIACIGSPWIFVRLRAIRFSFNARSVGHSSLRPERKP